VPRDAVPALFCGTATLFLAVCTLVLPC